MKAFLLPISFTQIPLLMLTDFSHINQLSVLLPLRKNEYVALFSQVFLSLYVHKINEWNALSSEVSGFREGKDCLVS